MQLEIIHSDNFEAQEQISGEKGEMHLLQVYVKLKFTFLKYLTLLNSISRTNAFTSYNFALGPNVRNGHSKNGRIS
jgi:hypothetical protein